MEPTQRTSPLSGALLVLATITFAACNAITGADQLVLYGDNVSGDGEGGDGGGLIDGPGPSGSGAGPATTSGVGGSSSSGGHTGGDPTMTTTSTTTSTTSTSTTTTSTTTSTSSGGPLDCVYPDAGFGVNEGNHVQGNLAWQGYSEADGQSGTVSIQDYFDCDGSKGIHALLIVNSATWCGACQQEASDLPSHAASFAQKGIRVLTLMVQNASGQPASLATATSWRSNFALDAYATASDPNFSFAGSGNVGLPLQILVDPRTMTIVDRSEGFGGYTAVTQLAAQNAD